MALASVQLPAELEGKAFERINEAEARSLDARNMSGITLTPEQARLLIPVLAEKDGSKSDSTQTPSQLVLLAVAVEII